MYIDINHNNFHEILLYILCLLFWLLSISFRFSRRQNKNRSFSCRNERPSCDNNCKQFNLSSKCKNQMTYIFLFAQNFRLPEPIIPFSFFWFLSFFIAVEILARKFSSKKKVGHTYGKALIAKKRSSKFSKLDRSRSFEHLTKRNSDCCCWFMEIS